mgnify:CR=1 FL=1
MLGAEVIQMSGHNWAHDLGKALKSVGIPGLSNISEDVDTAREELSRMLQSSEEIINTIPRNLSVPARWGGRVPT